VADWVVWLVGAGALLLAELFTLTFVLGLFGVAALVAAGAAAVGLPALLQVLVFAVVSGSLWFVVRPLERRHRQAPALVTGAAALGGRIGVVTEAVTDRTGRVKLGGESWAARPLSPGGTIEVGSTVAIARVDGATVVVYPEEL
jgi:membrane protein implicated in regulation of membrane protease activity